MLRLKSSSLCELLIWDASSMQAANLVPIRLRDSNVA
jgi:hypothetical protein